MVEKTGVVLDRSQVKKAVQALQAYLKTQSSGESALLDGTQQISLLFTLWKIPKAAQNIRIPLPHGQRVDTEEACLFTRDEPNMTPEQTQRFYKTLLEQKGVKNITEIIPYKALKTEYKPHEAKRRLLSNFDVFLSDARVHRLLPCRLGKHFFERKKEPLCVDLQSKHLARDIQRVIQGTNLKVNNKGCCCMARVGHSSLSPDEITDNIEACVQTAVAKLLTKGPVMKMIHLKSETSVALPIFTSDLGNLKVLEKNEAAEAKKRKDAKKKAENPKQTGAAAEEEIPMLVPIETPRKKPKLEKPPKKKQMEKKLSPAAGKTGKKSPNKRNRKMGKKVSKVKVKK